MTLPAWIKSVAKDWGASQITDDEYIQCIQFLVDHGVIKLPSVVCPTSTPVTDTTPNATSTTPTTGTVHNIAVDDSIKQKDKPQ